MTGCSPHNALMILKPLFAGDDLPALGPEPRVGRTLLAELNRQLDSVFKKNALSDDAQSLVRSTALLWHDYLDESHTLSQDIESADGSFLHGIMHRREPDYANAKYWFRRVGTHPSFSEIARRVGDLLGSTNHGDLKRQLIPDGRWDAFAMVDAVESAACNRCAADYDPLLRQIQRIEFEVLLERFSAVTTH